jgi:hypothetical protein
MPEGRGDVVPEITERTIDIKIDNEVKRIEDKQKEIPVINEQEQIEFDLLRWIQRNR